MTDDQFWRIVVVSGALAGIAAFRPQLLRWWRRLGYRDEREVDSTSPRRLLFIVVAVIGFFVFVAGLEAITRLFK